MLRNLVVVSDHFCIVVSVVKAVRFLGIFLFWNVGTCGNLRFGSTIKKSGFCIGFKCATGRTCRRDCIVEALILKRENTCLFTVILGMTNKYCEMLFYSDMRKSKYATSLQRTGYRDIRENWKKLDAPIFCT